MYAETFGIVMLRVLFFRIDMYNCKEAGKSKIETKGVIVSFVNAGMK
jgi:hypothetical protein